MSQARLTGVRTRILAIALIPSVVLLTIGIAIAGYLANQGQQAKNYAEAFDENLGPTRELVLAAEQERLLSMWHLAGQGLEPRALSAARARFDAAVATMAGATTTLADTGGATVNDIVGAFDQLKTHLPLVRGGIDVGAMPLADVYTFYSELLDGMFRASATVVNNPNVPDPESALDLLRSIDLLNLVEAMSRASALTVAAASPAGLPPPLLAELRNQVGSYHAAIDQLAGQLDTATAQRARAITESPAWQRVSAMEDAVLTSASIGPGTPQSLPMSITDWRDAANQVSDQLAELWVDQNSAAQRRAAAAGETKARNSLLAGGAMAGIAVFAFLLSLWLANRLIGRLKRLRVETLALADERLPDIVHRLSQGKHVDAETEVAALDFGRDEIGAVATAFNHAHTAAVAAAVAEARTREGVRAVFLNIAHRSQIVVHRLLEVLDEAERTQEDPAVLDTLFRLDHLATRERRNAENLIILGGGRPGRTWRRPVPLMDLVRSAVGETADYTRVHIGRLPQVDIVGAAVADLIHLLAELVDNAASFSPPESRVHITGNIVGKGVVVEISDQGIGMAPDDLRRAKEMLADPPGFAVARLSEDSRLGLFVVAQLGVRHGISVRLTDSDYGGIRAIVLIPTSLRNTELVAVDRQLERRSGVAPGQPGGEVRAQPGGEAPGAQSPVFSSPPSAPVRH